MIKYTAGDLLKSSTDALVNTVNCEGYMGKGIAYQFKIRFPENNKDYIKACKSGQLVIGTLHYSQEHDKLIINFPTKDKWRAKSKIEYIEKGLDALIVLIKQLSIKSISLPPLGSGNGGLLWSEVRLLIEHKLKDISSFVDIIVYEPSKSSSTNTTIEPKLSTSALVLMEIKNQLQIFNKLRLQRAAFLVDVFSPSKYFKFKKHINGPYDNSITTISNNIKQYQAYHRVSNTDEAKTILYNKIISETVTTKISGLMPFIAKACSYVNSIETDDDLEFLTTILFIIDNNNTLSNEEIIQKFMSWPGDTAKRFSKDEVLNGIEKLYVDNIIETTLVGYSIARDNL